MLKRTMDILISFTALLCFSPLLIPVLFLVWRQDRHSPFYIAARVGRDEKLFQMVKIRSMVMNADKSGVDSTSSSDRRITPVGQFIRKFKLDEVSQLWNVLRGDMSLVGPRPNVKRETDLYTIEEKKLLSVKPGITDFASIVFADEGEILRDAADPDISYNQLIRPGKSRLGIFYIEHANALLDLRLLFLTALAIVSRESALAKVSKLLETRGASDDLVQLAARRLPLVPAAPPGASAIVQSRATAA